MANNHNSLGEDLTPDWTTQKKLAYPDGTVVGISNQVWLFKRVPLGPVDTAASMKDAMGVGQSIMNALVELESITSVPVNRRSMVQSRYREFQMLLVNIPRRYEPDANQSPQMRDFLSQMWPNRRTMHRILLFGVRLNPSVKGRTWKDTFNNLADSLSLNDMGVNMSEYDADRKRIDDHLTRAGFVTPTPEEMRVADSWWNEGRHPDVPYLVHADHLHMFTQPTSMNAAARLERDYVDCRDSAWRKLKNHHTLSMVAFDSFNFEFKEAGSRQATFVSELLRQGAMAVSFRGMVEPTVVTRSQLRAGRRRYVEDITEAGRTNSINRAEQDEKLGALTAMESAYAKAGGRVPTVHKCSIIAAINGFNEQTGSYGIGQMFSASFSSMVERQERALAEMMIGSKFRSNPLLRDLPAPALAYTGAPGLAMVGDRSGALLGMTEHDDQPAYLSPTAASTADGLPMMLVAGQTGSGKTQVLLFLAAQFDEMGSPQVIVDPKRKSDHTEVVRARGGQVTRLDQIIDADGILDPLRFAQDRQAGLDTAQQMLMFIDPWGDANPRQWEVKLMVSLRHGVDKGATCIGQALSIAKADGIAPADMVDPILNLRNTSGQFSAICGMDPTTEGLSVSDGITLIMAGEIDLQLPQPGKEPEGMQQRLAVALVRMMVFGSAMALTERRGVLHFDEAWVAMIGGAAEVERLGRLARSQEVLPILYTQRVSDAVNNGLRGYISRGLILAIADPDEARAACELFDMEPTEERLGRIMASATIGGGTDVKQGQPNFNSLRAQFAVNEDGSRGRNLRGSVGYYKDLTGRVCPVVIDLPPWFLQLSSTNTEDIRRRKSNPSVNAAAQAKLEALGSREESERQRRANAERAAAAAYNAAAAMDVPEAPSAGAPTASSTNLFDEE